MDAATKTPSRTIEDVAPDAPTQPAADDALLAEIAKRAYGRYCDRGCTGGADVEDWLAAEREVLAERSDQA